MTASPTPWSDALDTLEERLRQQEAAVRGEAAVPPTRPLPAPPGDLPAELLPRAVALLERCRSLEVQVAETLARGRRMRSGSAYSRGVGEQAGHL